MLDESLTLWLQEHAEALDADAGLAGALLPRLDLAGLFKAGVPASEGGTGTPPSAAIGAVADLARYSMSAAFVFWAQRAHRMRAWQPEPRLGAAAIAILAGW